MKKSAETRKSILLKAFDLIYSKGYQSTSVDEIIATMQLTKGAFYYHFKHKDEMGLALINDILAPEIYQAFVLPLENTQKPTRDIYAMMENLLFNMPMLQIQLGCPVANLVQEMSSISNEFSINLLKLVGQWHSALTQSFKNGKKAGKIRSDLDEQQASYFIISGYWGVRNLGKLTADPDVFRIYLKELKRYLKTMK